MDPKKLIVEILFSISSSFFLSRRGFPLLLTLACTFVGIELIRWITFLIQLE
jgi:hypothetical protein